jgi:hypothetical protein
MAVIGIFLMPIEYTYQPFPLQGPPKFAQIGIFGMKIYHLATPDSTGKSEIHGCSQVLLNLVNGETLLVFVNVNLCKF